MQSATINECLGSASHEWEAKVREFDSKEDQGLATLKLEQIEQLHASMTVGIENPVTLDTMISISTDMASEIEEYRHCSYQAAVAAVVASH